MSQIDLIIFTSIVLLITFSLGWLAHVLIEKLYYKSERKQTNDQVTAEAFLNAESEHALIVDKLKKSDAELTNKLAQTQAELKATMDGLHIARVEIESLRENSQKTRKRKK
jgi:prophage endopeptidase